jgi:mannosyltransferase OCH1-like enzyme
MLKLVQWNFAHLAPSGYETKLWRDPDVEDLIDAYGPEVRRLWEHAKVDPNKSRLGDIARVLILYSEGGIYYNADTVLCTDNLDYMTDMPGAVLFPFQLFT